MCRLRASYCYSVFPDGLPANSGEVMEGMGRGVVDGPDGYLVEVGQVTGVS